MPSATKKVIDVAAFTAYSFQDCMDHCVQWNKNTGSSQKTCMAVTYNANLTQALSGPGIAGSCWLKDARGIKYADDETINYQLVASAYIDES
jgi:hypothetical protein